MKTPPAGWARRRAPSPLPAVAQTRCRRGVASGSAADSSERLPLPSHAVHLRNESSHAKILERASVAVAALLHPEIFHTQDFSAVPIRPEEVRVALEHGDDILVIDAGQDPFLLAPHT